MLISMFDAIFVSDFYTSFMYLTGKKIILTISD